MLINVGEKMADPLFTGPAGLTSPTNEVVKLAGSKGLTKPTMAAAGNDAIITSTPPTATKRFFIAPSLTVLTIGIVYFEVQSPFAAASLMPRELLGVFSAS
jgi:hypothetical protein